MKLEGEDHNPWNNNNNNNNNNNLGRQPGRKIHDGPVEKTEEDIELWGHQNPRSLPQNVIETRQDQQEDRDQFKKNNEALTTSNGENPVHPASFRLSHPDVRPSLRGLLKRAVADVMSLNNEGNHWDGGGGGSGV